MKELKCPNCGAPINEETMRCEYCGARFERNDNFIINQPVLIEHPQVVPLKTVMRIDNDFATLPRYEKYITDSIASSLAEKVAQYMEVTFQDDPANNQVIAQGRVRLVPPSVRFL